MKKRLIFEIPPIEFKMIPIFDDEPKKIRKIKPTKRRKK